MATTLPASAGPVIQCDKCKQGVMQTARVPKTSPGLRIVGFTLWVPALIFLILSAGCGLLVGGVGGSATNDGITKARADAANQLLDITAIRPDAIDTFQRTGTIDRNAVLVKLSPSDQVRVESILDSYDARVAGAAIGGSAAVGMAGLGVVAVYIVCVPLFIVGLLLTLKKNVWKCGTCGYVFDRA